MLLLLLTESVVEALARVKREGNEKASHIVPKRLYLDKAKGVTGSFVPVGAMQQWEGEFGLAGGCCRLLPFLHH